MSPEHAKAAKELVRKAFEEPDDRLAEIIGEAKRWLDDEVPERRKGALEVIGHVACFRGHRPSADEIKKILALADDDFPGVRAEVACSMSMIEQIPEAERVRVLLLLLSDEEEMVREEAAAAAGDTKLKSAAGALIHVMENAKSESLKVECAIALGALRDPRAVGPLVGVLARRSTYDRVLACEALGEIGDRSAVPPLSTLARGWFTNFQERLYALAALSRLGENWASEKLRSRTRSWSRAERELAEALLKELKQ